MLEEAFGPVMPSLQAALAAYEAAKEEKTRAEAAAKEAAAAAAELEQKVIDLMVMHAEQSGVDALTVTVNARRYQVVQKDYWNIPAAARGEAFPALRDLGLGYLIQERVDDRTLTRVLNEVTEEYGGTLPDEYGPLQLTRYTKTTLSSRKV